MKKNFILVIATAFALASCTTQNKNIDLEIFPEPESIVVTGSGARFHSVPTFDAQSEDLMKLATTFAVPFDGQPLPEIKLTIDSTLEYNEYIVDSSKKIVIISGGSSEGVWWGLQVLTQLLQQSDVDKVPGLIIKGNGSMR